MSELTYKNKFEVEEEINRGGPCLVCGRAWVPMDPEKPNGPHMLNHTEDCAYYFSWFTEDEFSQMDQWSAEYVVSAIFHTANPHLAINCYACYCDLPPTAICPLHGEQVITGSGSTGPAHDPYGVEILACGDALNPFFDEPVILAKGSYKNDAFSRYE